MVNLNGIEISTCAELAKSLETFGDRPLFSGNGWYAVIGFAPSKEGVQVIAKACPPAGQSGKDLRKGGL